MNVRSIWLLHRDEIAQEARAQAEAGEPCRHGFEPGSPQAISWELAWHEAAMEQRAEVEG